METTRPLERGQALRDQLGPALAREFEEDEQTMGSLGEWVWEQGLEQGVEQGVEQGTRAATITSIERVAKNLSLSVERAMDVLEIPEAERAAYREALAYPAPQS